MPHAATRLPALLALLCLFSAGVRAEVVGIEIHDRQPVLDGRAFGDVGAYERITGTIHFAFDPGNEHNAAVVDLGKAPVEDSGRVTAWGDLMILAPVDPSRGSGTALVEVSNRGGKASLRYFNRGRYAATPDTAEHFGDGLLMEQGLTVVWVGWQFDVPQEDGRLRLHVPTATSGDDPLTGLVRSDWTVDVASDVLDLAHRDHVPYAVLDADDPENVLTVRSGRLAPRQVVPRERWRFVAADEGEAEDEGDEALTRVTLDGGFEAGRIYELVYRAAHPAVVGLGLAAIRDTMAWLKHDPTCPTGVEHGLAVGISQTGRFLRHFLYQGFNTDERGRQVFDGLLVHTAGAGRGSFNHRFAQPSRDGHRYSAFFYPTDLFPFSGRVQRDPVTGRSDGLAARHLADGHLPKVFFTNTGYEYWGRAGSLLHTSADGSADVEPLPNERIYHLRSGQHFVSRFPPGDDARLPDGEGWRGNPLDFLWTERALLVALQQWVEEGVEPPPSAYPRIDDGTLVPIEELGFPEVPGLPAPTVIHQAYRADYGRRWTQGLVTVQPPALGPAFPSLVSRVDAFGNELAGVPTVETLVPVATYTPWSLRAGFPGGEHELVDFYGNYVPLPRTESERLAAGDGRPSLEQTHGSREQFMEQVRAAARDLVARRLLLPSDVLQVVDRAEAQWLHAQAN